MNRATERPPGSSVNSQATQFLRFDDSKLTYGRISQLMDNSYEQQIKEQFKPRRFTRYGFSVNLAPLNPLYNVG